MDEIGKMTQVRQFGGTGKQCWSRVKVGTLDHRAGLAIFTTPPPNRRSPVDRTFVLQRIAKTAKRCPGDAISIMSVRCLSLRNTRPDQISLPFFGIIIDRISQSTEDLGVKGGAEWGIISKFTYTRGLGNSIFPWKYENFANNILAGAFRLGGIQGCLTPWNFPSRQVRKNQQDSVNLEGKKCCA